MRRCCCCCCCFCCCCCRRHRFCCCCYSASPPTPSPLFSRNLSRNTSVLCCTLTKRLGTLPCTCLCSFGALLLLQPAVQSRVNSTSVRIWAFDHNFDGGLMHYPQQLLRSPARDFIDGIAYHNYAGKPHTMCSSELQVSNPKTSTACAGQASSMTALHEEFPASSIFFTEVVGVFACSCVV